MARQTPQGPSWTAPDAAMLLTCQMINDIRGGVVPPLRCPTMFRLSEGVVAFIQSPVSVAELRAAGDGSYSTSSTLVWGTGALGVAALGASLAASAASNSNSRQRAMMDAQVMFRHQFDATMYVTNTGWVFHASDGVFEWAHSDAQAMQMAGPNTLVMQGESERGRLTWQIRSPFAELVFVMWALDQHPNHPQLIDGSWLQPGWLDHARAFGQDPGLTSPILASATQDIRLPGGHRAQLEPPQDEFGLQSRYGEPHHH